MRRFPRRRPILLLMATAFLLHAAPAVAQTPTLFVEEFNRLLEEKQAQRGVNYKVEGRISSIAPRLLKLQNCPQTFRPAAGETFGTAPDNRGVAVLFGRLDRQEGKSVFVVSNLRFVRDDAAMYAIKRGAVRGDQPDDWYALARWAGRRAEFYDDDDLREKGVTANASGIRLERRLLNAARPADLLALADKAGELQLPDAIKLGFLHEAHRLTWDDLQQQKSPDLQPLLNDLKEQLPGVSKRLPTPQPELEQSYRDKPLAVYRRANERARRKLHRIFYSDVLLASLKQQAAAAGRDRFELADRIDELLPERHALAEEYREQELRERFDQVGRLTRQEMLDLADRFRRRERADDADRTIRDWLKATEAALRQEGADGLMRAADQYIDLLEDRERGAELLKEAYQLSPDSERIAEKLTRLDYRLHNGRWIPRREFKQLPKDPIQEAIREGRVVKNMTAAQVRSTLGAPTAITRIATSGQLSELWVYGRRNATRITVHLLRSSPRAPLIAVRISQIAAR